MPGTSSWLEPRPKWNGSSAGIYTRISSDREGDQLGVRTTRITVSSGTAHDSGVGRQSPPCDADELHRRFYGTVAGIREVGGRIFDRVAGELLLVVPPVAGRYVRDWAEEVRRVTSAASVVERAVLFADCAA